MILIMRQRTESKDRANKTHGRGWTTPLRRIPQDRNRSVSSRPVPCKMLTVSPMPISPCRLMRVWLGQCNRESEYVPCYGPVCDHPVGPEGKPKLFGARDIPRTGYFAAIHIVFACNITHPSHLRKRWCPMTPRGQDGRRQGVRKGSPGGHNLPPIEREPTVG